MLSSRMKFFARKTALLCGSALMTAMTLVSASAYASVSQKPLFLTGQGLPPNILLIPDTSESMQEGLSQGRVALDWSNPACSPGPSIDSSCVSGAAYEESKGSVVKRVGRSLVEQYRGQINMGLLSYQQQPASTARDDVFSNSNNLGTVRWRLMHRIVDARFSLNATPSFYQPDHDEPWDSELKRFREPHPTISNAWVFYNVAITGYHRESNNNWETSDRTYFCQYNGNNFTEGDFFPYRCYNSMSVNADGTPSYSQLYQNFNVTLTDSMRQRGVGHYGQNLLFVQLNRTEWRANTSPGLGYLHVPIGGFDDDGAVDSDHWDSILNKLQPQSVAWNGTGNPMTNASWPLISAGLTPLAGTMQTATDYFIGRANSTGSRFRNSQGYRSNLSIPQSCGANAAIWVTDGLPSVSPSGAALGDNPVQAMLQARDAVRDFYDTTGDHGSLGGPVRTYVVGFALPPGVQQLFSGHEEFTTDNPLDVLAAAGGTETAFSASNEAALESIMDQIFSEVLNEARSSAASAAASSTSLQTDTAIFVAGFDSTDWSGELKAYRVNRRESDEDSLLEETPAWDAEDKLPAPSARNIITWVPDTNVTAEAVWAQGNTRPFQINGTNGISAAQQALLASGSFSAADVVGWLRGDRSNEGTGASDMRSRSRVIGDIVNSRPLYIRNENFNYQIFPVADGGGATYSNFLQQNREKAPLIAVAANNGMLHVFDARLPCRTGETTANDGCHPDGGREVFAYVPNALMGKLPNLTEQNYDREYYFDGSARLGHVYDTSSSSWRRILVVSLGAGGKAVAAIDVDSKQVLWEMDASTNDDLGYVLGEPILGRAATGEWITVIPNGVDSESGIASLIAVDTLTGKLHRTWKPDDLNPQGNAMFSPLPLDVTGDRKIDRIYSGDLQGNLWRLDLVGSDASDWRVINAIQQGNSDRPLFQARTAGGAPQPITVRPNAVRDPAGFINIVFGTGKYYEVGDNAVTNVPTQTLYGIRDEDARVARSDLQQQSIIYEGTAFDYEVRATTDNQLAANAKGWYMDLAYNGSNRGERVVQDPIIRGGRVVFATLIPEPDPDPCEPGNGTGWIMEFDAFSGSRLTQSPWDLSGEGFGNESFIDVPGVGLIPASGIRSPVGIPTIPAVVEDHLLSDREYKFVVGSTGEVWELPDESRDGAGRLFWRQLR